MFNIKAIIETSSEIKIDEHFCLQRFVTVLLAYCLFPSKLMLFN